MNGRPHVVAVSGSLRDGSYTKIALQRVLAAAESLDATTELLDLREYTLPPIDPDAKNAGDARRLRERLSAADAIILGTPVYHGSYAAPLKNALDYSGFDEFENKTVGLVGTAGGGFPITALDHLRSVGRSLNAWVIPHQVGIPRARNKFDGDDVVDDGLADRLDTLGERAVQYANIEPDPRSLEAAENTGADD